MQDITNNDASNVNSDRSSMEETNNDDNLHNNNLEDKKIADHLSVKSEATGMAEVVEDPKYWPKRKKNMILFIVSLAGMFGPISSTYVNIFMTIFQDKLDNLNQPLNFFFRIFYPAVPKVQTDLNTSEVFSNGLSKISMS